MQRLSALDESFLHLENADVQANIGGVSVFEGPAPKHAEVLRRIEAKLAAGSPPSTSTTASRCGTRRAVGLVGYCA